MRPLDLRGALRAPVRQLRRATTPHRIVDPTFRLEGPEVALTFDDGPHPDFSPAILDILATHGVTATFFMVGRNARRYPGIVRRVIAEGHTVGSHSMSHPNPWELSPVALWRDYRAGHLEVSNAAGHTIELFRPPKGHLDRRGALAVRAARLRPVLWSLDPRDWEPDLSPDDIVGRLGIPAAGDVILLHEAVERPPSPASLDRTSTVQALARFLERSTRDGVRFVALR